MTKFKDKKKKKSINKPSAPLLNRNSSFRLLFVRIKQANSCRNTVTACIHSLRLTQLSRPSVKSAAVYLGKLVIIKVTVVLLYKQGSETPIQIRIIQIDARNFLQSMFSFHLRQDL